MFAFMENYLFEMALVFPPAVFKHPSLDEILRERERERERHREILREILRERDREILREILRERE